MDHNLTVEYTSDDDGVWLFCPCGWRKNLGYSPPVAALVSAQAEHDQWVQNTSAGDTN